MHWVKLYTDVLGDVKLMRGARKGLRGLAYLPWLLAFAAEADDEGRLSVNGEPAEPEDIARLIPDGDPAQVAACMASCVALGVLEDDGHGVLRFTAWERRTGKPSDSPEASRERKRRQREKSRDGVTPGHAGQSVTSHAAVTNGHATELETEEEADSAQSQTQMLAATSGGEPAAVPDVDPSGAVTPLAVTIAANRAVTAVWGEQPSPYLPGSRGAMQLACDLAAVPLAFTEGAIRTVCERRKARGEPPPRALAYFASAVGQMHAEDKARRDAAAAPAAPALALVRVAAGGSLPPRYAGKPNAGDLTMRNALAAFAEMNDDD